MSEQKMIFLKYLILCFSLVLLSACATSPNSLPNDPLEPYNRLIFSFNDGLDDIVLKPVAKGYDAVIPDPIKSGVSNFFSNLDDVFVTINDLLQFKLVQTIEDGARLIFNSSIGLFGLFDVATPMGLPKHHEDFGQTLAVWGVDSGPYMVWPFFGSSTLRNTTSLLIESAYNPISFITPEDLRFGDAFITTLEAQQAQTIRYTLAVTFVVDARYKLLKSTNILEQAALDKYSFVRDAYLQQRKNLINDGKQVNETNLDELQKSAEDLELEEMLELDLEKSLGL